jgi:hypothetical protein
MALLRKIGLVGLALMVCGVAIAQALPVRYVTVDEGRIAETAWSLAVGAGEEKRCYRLTMEGSGDFTQGMVCGREVPRFHLWDPLFGSSGGDASAVVSTSAPEVRRVNLLLAHPGSERGTNWHSFQMRLLTEDEARRARLKRDFRYAVLTGVGELCVKKVRAFDFRGRLLEKRDTPCEY